MWGTELGGGLRLRLLERHHAETLFALTDRNRDHLRPWLPWVDGVRSAADSLAFVVYLGVKPLVIAWAFEASEDEVAPKVVAQTR
jgi:hypothetical protein